MVFLCTICLKNKYIFNIVKYFYIKEVPRYTCQRKISRISEYYNFLFLHQNQKLLELLLILKNLLLMISLKWFNLTSHNIIERYFCKII